MSLICKSHRKCVGKWVQTRKWLPGLHRGLLPWIPARRAGVGVGLEWDLDRQAQVERSG